MKTETVQLVKTAQDLIVETLGRIPETPTLERRICESSYAAIRALLSDLGAADGRLADICQISSAPKSDLARPTVGGLPWSHPNASPFADIQEMEFPDPGGRPAGDRDLALLKCDDPPFLGARFRVQYKGKGWDAPRSGTIRDFTDDRVFFILDGEDGKERSWTRRIFRRAVQIAADRDARPRPDVEYVWPDCPRCGYDDPPARQTIRVELGLVTGVCPSCGGQRAIEPAVLAPSSFAARRNAEPEPAPIVWRDCTSCKSMRIPPDTLARTSTGGFSGRCPDCGMRRVGERRS